MESLKFHSRSVAQVTIAVHDGGRVSLNCGGVFVSGGEVRITRGRKRASIELWKNTVHCGDVMVDNHVARFIDVWLAHRVDDYVAE